MGIWHKTKKVGETPEGEDNELKILSLLYIPPTGTVAFYIQFTPYVSPSHTIT